ncbi:RHS repeat-associated core domain-containing protein, partial [Dysgonomonas sp. ZJ709]|uniref:RHS repeat-associated core domain-containing protein n=1 Tax=Dysgonomonas sp. ZJ709 TaxID=2709797 RepID=UPI0021039762
ELEQEHQLNMYDYHARQMEPGTGRFMSVDPLAEKYYNISPYAYVKNNPLKYIDPDGKQVIIPPFLGMNPVLAGSSTPLLGVADVVKVGVRAGVGETVRVGVRTAAEVGSKTSESTGGNKPSINIERLNAGRRIEGEQLQKLGLGKNTESITRIDPKTGKGGTTVPDGIKNGGSTEIKNLKDGATQSLTKQLRLQKEFSNGNGQVPKLHINRGANLSKPLQEAGFEVTRYSVIPVTPQDNTSVVIKKLEF